MAFTISCATTPEGVKITWSEAGNNQVSIYRATSTTTTYDSSTVQTAITNGSLQLLTTMYYDSGSYIDTSVLPELSDDTASNNHSYTYVAVDGSGVAVIQNSVSLVCNACALTETPEANLINVQNAKNASSFKLEVLASHATNNQTVALVALVLDNTIDESDLRDALKLVATTDPAVEVKKAAIISMDSINTVSVTEGSSSVTYKPVLSGTAQITYQV